MGAEGALVWHYNSDVKMDVEQEVGLLHRTPAISCILILNDSLYQGR